MWLDKLRGGEHIQMKGQSRARQPEAMSYRSRGKAARGVADKQAKDTQPGFLSERRKRIDCQ